MWNKSFEFARRKFDHRFPPLFFVPEGSIVTRGGQRETERKGHMKTEAAVGMTPSQTEEHLDHENLKEAKKVFLLENLEGIRSY